MNVIHHFELFFLVWILYQVLDKSYFEWHYEPVDDCKKNDKNVPFALVRISIGYYVLWTFPIDNFYDKPIHYSIQQVFGPIFVQMALVIAFNIDIVIFYQ